VSTIAARTTGAIRAKTRSQTIRGVLEFGGFAAGTILIAFGIGAIVMGFDGRSTVSDSLKNERITGTPDMTPALTSKAVKEAGLTGVDIPSCNVAGKSIDTGSEARCFAQYMRIHALEGTGGFVYAEMGRFQAKPDTPKAQLAPGGGTDNEEYAVVDPKSHGPAANSERNVWVTETALSTAMNASYMADRTSLFGVVVGIALLLSGIGFIVLAFSALHRKRTGAASS
jgi:hypothetical protein